MTSNDLIAKIQNPATKQKDILPVYTNFVHNYLTGDSTLNIPAIDRAIAERWSEKSLRRIKSLAWDWLRENSED